MKIRKALLIAAGLTLAGGPAWSQDAPAGAPAAAPAPGARASQTNWWSQPGGENGPHRTVWAAHKLVETPYTGPNQPVTHIADILAAHKGQPRWDQPVVLTRDFDGHYVQMAPGDKTKCMFYADDRVVGWVYSGQLKITIDGQEPVIGKAGQLFDVAPRLSFCLETVGDQPAVFWRMTPAGQVPSYPESETPNPIPGYVYEKASITSTGGYDATNIPFVDYSGDLAAKSHSPFIADGHTSAHIIRAQGITQLPPDTDWGHFHENMVEYWTVIEGKLAVRISGIGIVHGELGDVIQANEGRWHRAGCEPNTGPCTRLAQTPRLKEGQVHYFQLGAGGE
jgi:mannose-6-phosphate isomerase-like protein (cupin superfamily)